MFEPLCVPPTHVQALAVYPGWVVSDKANVSAFNVPSESTGLVPDRSLLPAPLAVNVKSSTVFVPPLSLITTLRRCRPGALSSMRPWPTPH